jgi:hypothetical protein
MKTTTKPKRKLPRGLTLFSYESGHAYNGIRAHRQKNGWKLCRYIGGGATRAIDRGLDALAAMDEALANPRNWRAGAMTKKAADALREQGISVTGPRA